MAAGSAGERFSLLVADDGTVYSFGSNGNGRTGLGTASGNTLIATPIDTTNLAGLRVISIAAGQDHSLLLAVVVPEPHTATLLMLASLPLFFVRTRTWRATVSVTSIARLHKAGTSVAEIARTMQLSRPTVYKAIEA